MPAGDGGSVGAAPEAGCTAADPIDPAAVAVDGVADEIGDESGELAPAPADRLFANAADGSPGAAGATFGTEPPVLAPGTPAAAPGTPLDVNDDNGLPPPIPCKPPALRPPGNPPPALNGDGAGVRGAVMGGVNGATGGLTRSSCDPIRAVPSPAGASLTSPCDPMTSDEPFGAFATSSLCNPISLSRSSSRTELSPRRPIVPSSSSAWIESPGLSVFGRPPAPIAATSGSTVFCA
jgi:hypothetical protein